MNTCNIIFVLLLCIGAAIPFEVITFGNREPGDRPIYINTIQTNETAELTDHVLYYEWFGNNETFTQLYIEASSWRFANLFYGSYPMYRRTFELDVGAHNTTQLTVSIIVFGFVNQPLANSPPLVRAAGNKVVERQTNFV